ncbi:hypothetical protein ACUXZZ_45390 (plasmid) [Streptomyces graminifolii]|uniref:hypothetical protein n=1 Tax=Streptomyces graminifolii TaxID=1266771 RepID=UPI00405A120F
MDDVLNGPPLPAEYAGKAIVWTPWRNSPVGGRTAVVRPCKACGELEPWWFAVGVAEGVRRACGYYCPGCGELWVYWQVPPAPGKHVGRLELIEHSMRQERLDAAMERVAERMRQGIKKELRRRSWRCDVWPYGLNVHGE